MNLLYSIYFILPSFDRLGLPGKAINRIMLFLLKRILDLIMPSYFIRTMDKAGTGINKEKREIKYIVSLTSIPTRINDIWITIETILRQNFKPDKIILWLAEEQFPDKKVPDNLSRLKERGLTIEFCEDLRSHKKYFYAMKKYPNDIIITLDDDLYYDKNVISNIVELNRKFPGLISTNRAHKITLKENKINPYRKWKHNVTDKAPSHLLVATGGAGTLYPPGTFSESAFNKILFGKLCMHADDIWLKTMALLNNRMVVTNNRYNKSFVTVASTQKQKLVSSNVINGGNDVQFKNLLDYFGIDISKFL